MICLCRLRLRAFFAHAEIQRLLKEADDAEERCANIHEQIGTVFNGEGGYEPEHYSNIQTKIKAAAFVQQPHLCISIVIKFI